jgi:hypothetical protein
LVQNVITGRDDAGQSATQLGADKRISMWQRDSQVGLVVIKAPRYPKLITRYAWLNPSSRMKTAYELPGHERRNQSVGQGCEKFTHSRRPRQLIRTLMIVNVVQGKDKAVQSMKLLGQDEEVNIFTPDTAVGIFQHANSVRFGELFRHRIERTHR